MERDPDHGHYRPEAKKIVTVLLVIGLAALAAIVWVVKMAFAGAPVGH